MNRSFSNVVELKFYLQDLDKEKSFDIDVCSFLANQVAREWIPLFTSKERLELWIPYFVSYMPYSLPVLVDSLSNCVSIEEGAIVCEAISECLQQCSLERCFSFSSSLKLLPSIPSKCVNSSTNKCPPFLVPSVFFPWLCDACAVLITSRPEGVALILERLILLNETLAIAKSFSQLSEEQLESAAACIMKCARFEKLLPSFLACFSVAKFFAVANPLCRDESASYVLEYQLLTMKVLPTKQARTLVSFHCMRGSIDAERIAKALASVWSDEYFASKADIPLQLQVSRAMKVLFQCCGSKITSQIIPSLLPGIHVRLSLPENEKRFVGMAVAEFTSSSVENVKALDFGEPATKDLLEWDEEQDVEEQVVLEESNTTTGKKEEEIDPDEVYIKPNDDDDEADDDDDSISSYELDEGESLVSKGPLYLRDCLNCLMDGKQKADRLELGLQAVEGLVRSSPCDLEDVAVPLTSALLHASDEFNIVNFETMRIRGLIALASQCKSLVPTFVGKQFCEPNWSIQQRMDMLECMMEAASELSNQTNTQDIIVDSVKIQEIEDNGRTRRWGNALHKKSRPLEGKKNGLISVVETFFWPFQEPLKAGFAQKFDPIIVARLLLYLGRVISMVPLSQSKSRMMNALAEAIWVHRWTKELHVVRSCMVALTEALISFEADTLVEEFSDVVDETINWLTDVARDGPDQQTAEVGRTCVSELVMLLKQASIVERQKELGL